MMPPGAAPAGDDAGSPIVTDVLRDCSEPAAAAEPRLVQYRGDSHVLAVLRVFHTAHTLAAGVRNVNKNFRAWAQVVGCQANFLDCGRACPLCAGHAWTPTGQPTRHARLTDRPTGRTAADLGQGIPFSRPGDGVAGQTRMVPSMGRASSRVPNSLGSALGSALGRALSRALGGRPASMVPNAHC